MTVFSSGILSFFSRLSVQFSEDFAPKMWRKLSDFRAVEACRVSGCCGFFGPGFWFCFCYTMRPPALRSTSFAPHCHKEWQIRCLCSTSCLPFSLLDVVPFVAYLLFFGKIPTPIKIKLALPPPHPKKPRTPPSKEEFYGHGGFPTGRTQNCHAPIKLAQPFWAPELRAEILWTPRFFWFLQLSFQMCLKRVKSK